MLTKAIHPMSTVERMLDEVEEYARAVGNVRCKMKRHKLGSEPYHDLLPSLSVQLDVLRLKARHAALALNEYEESLPDDD